MGTASTATAGTGSGGGGGSFNDGAGGNAVSGAGASGSVIIRYTPVTNIDYSVTFNASTQYGLASGAQVIPTSTSATFSVEAWINPAAIDIRNRIIVSQSSGGNTFYLGYRSGQFVIFRVLM
jgi:hypothetical protein